MKVLIVDDEKKIVEVVSAYLEKEGYNIVKAFSGKEAIEVFNKENPSIIILDLMLPDISGEEVCQIIRRKSRVPIIMLTAKVDEESILEGFNIGADDYVTKPFSLRQLVARVKALIRRSDEDVIPLTDILRFNDDSLIIDNFKREVSRKGNIVSLTNTEYKLLITMAKYPRRVFTREELLRTALGEDYDGFDRVIDTHIKNLRQKIEDESKSPVYILTVHGVGYKFGGE